MKTAGKDLDRTPGMEGLCDPETGVCALPGMEAASGALQPERPVGEVIYVGDPMCSWCWGGSPGLKQLEAEAIGRGLPFRVLVGGLRAGGGDPWNDRFKGFLRHHWTEIAERTGQPFSLRFLDRPAFNYDTEPACRAFVVLRGMLEETAGARTGVYEAFAAIQRRFYTEGEDPTEPGFYESICTAHGLDFGTFLTRFEHPDAKRATAAEFQEVRAMGVSGFPTVLYKGPAGIAPLASGYLTGSQWVAALGRAVDRQQVTG